MSNHGEPESPENHVDRGKARFGLGRVVLAIAAFWLAITTFAFVMDVVHRALTLLVVGAVVFVIVKLSRVSRP